MSDREQAAERVAKKYGWKIGRNEGNPVFCVPPTALSAALLDSEIENARLLEHKGFEGKQRFEQWKRERIRAERAEQENARRREKP